MLKLGGLFLAFLLVTGGVSFAESEINLLNPSLHWNASNSQAKLLLHDNYLRAEPKSGELKLINLTPLGLTTSDYDLLAIRIRSPQTGVAELFWAPRRDRFSIHRNYPFYVNNNYRTNLINLAAYNRDGSIINHFLLRGTGTFEISEIKLIKGNLCEKSVAAWQEFFGPLSRTQDTFAFMLICSPRLFGKTFVYFINIFLAVFLLMALMARGKKDLSRVFLLALLVVWSLAELNTLRNNFIVVQRDSGYLGKTLEAKRALINGGDLYAFIKFADRALPAGAAFDVLTSGPSYNYRAAYYLYPRAYETGAAYLLVYDARFAQKTFKHYKLWKTFRQGAYIYKS
jgi:hypothetical protein